MDDVIARIASLLNADTDAAFVEACGLFNGINDDDVFTTAANRFPSLMNYGPRGEWQGSVSNENGWAV